MWERIVYSFPLQLFFLHLKKNLLLVSFWVLLFLIVSQNFGSVLGIPFLFLDPEYLNAVSWQGFFIIGVALAIFTMAFHMTAYILDGAKFKFLAIVQRPFITFCLNNSIIPLAFYLLYLFCFISFQMDNEHENNWIILHYFFGFVAGTMTTLSLMYAYFRWTNKDFFVMFAGSVEKRLRKAKLPRANMLNRISETKKTKNKVLDFIGMDMRFHEVRQDLARFEAHQLLRVFDQNHLNMVVIQVILISVVFILGFFRESPLLQFPAAASSLLLLSILVMAVGAIAFWLRDWSIPTFVAALVVFNFLSSTKILNRPHAAFGLDYEKEPISYTTASLQQMLHPDSVEKDKRLTLGMLENWRRKFPPERKPKMVFFAASGGGQRAALWTILVMQEAEKASKLRLFDHTQMITGASGGLIGAGFFRELFLQHQDDAGIDYLDLGFLDQMSADNLNPIIFTLLVNDLLIRNQQFEYKGRSYLKDRGYSFEQQLNLNTNGILDKPIGAYREPELLSKIPMMPITPLITNDGRKLIIAPYSISYLGISNERLEGRREKSQGIDFRRFFAGHDAGNLRFISALRMGATFPFITPNIQLPSDPLMETMDSGLSDNFGIQDALRFIYVFRDWIGENTSGVVLITIRDSEKFQAIERKSPPTFLQKLFTPLKNIYINWDNVQTLHNENAYSRIQEMMPFPVQRIEFEYSTLQYLQDRGLADEDGVFNPDQQDILRASLNWRLTAREKKSILDNINNKFNQESLRKIREIRFLE
jgi:hypothetical protein